MALAFGVGYLVADDSDEVSKLRDQLTETEDELAGTENRASLSEATVEELEEENDSIANKLHAERSLNGKTEAADENTEFETDFEWQTAGTVGYLTIKPIDLSNTGSKWILTMEAKNEGSEPETPFCGDGGAVLEDGAERTYTGEALLSEGTDNCEELQPGLTGTFGAEFKLPEETRPAIALIYGDYDQEEEAKAWALPSE